MFDSGHGGLTVLRAVLARLPGQPFVYLGDHANAPYGGRSPEDVFHLTRRGVEALFDQGCRLVVLACNTAAAAALRRLQQQWLPIAYPDRRVVGVLVPMVEAITRVPWRARTPAAEPPPAETVAVFATAGTVATGAYSREVALRAPTVRVYQQACPDLVPLIERGAGDQALRPVVGAHVAALAATMRRATPDAALLGCTHYPLVAHLFAEALPPGVRILDQPAVVAESLAGYLRRHPAFAGDGPGDVRYLTTGDAERVDPLARRFLGRAAAFHRI